MGESSGLIDDEALRRARSREAAPDAHEGFVQRADISSEDALGARTASSAENESLASGTGGESGPSPLQPSRLLGHPALQRNVNAQPRADLFLELQHTQGNNYTRRLARSPSGARNHIQSPTSSVQRTPVQRDGEGKASSHQSGFDLHIEAANQGAFSVKGQMFEVRIPNDAAKEKSPNKESDTMLKVIKTVGPGSVELRKAFVTGELLKEIRIDILKLDKDSGKEVLAHSLTFHNLIVQSISFIAGSPLRERQPGHADDVEELETVSFRTRGKDASEK